MILHNICMQFNLNKIYLQFMKHRIHSKKFILHKKAYILGFIEYSIR